MLYSMLILGGVSETGRYYVAYVYAVEIFPTKLQNPGGLVIFMVMAVCKMYVCVYFMLSAVKDWNDMCYHGWAFAAVSGLMTLTFLHESPRYLISRGEFTEAMKTLPIKEKDEDPIELEEAMGDVVQTESIKEEE